MLLRWFGQSAFLLAGERRVLIDPFGTLEGLAARGIEFGYPPLTEVEADLVLITHEHPDHNAAEAAAGSPRVIRSTAGRLESPLGEVVAIASEHDAAAGTQRGPNTIFCFSLDGLRICHLGDLGQDELRPAQRQAIGSVDLLFVPVGGGPTLDGTAAAEVVAQLRPRLVVPMHYRTAAINFLEPVDGFVAALGRAPETVATSEVEVEPLLGPGGQTRLLLLAPPLPAA